MKITMTTKAATMIKAWVAQAGLLGVLVGSGCGGNEAAVVTVYVSEDQVFSEPILRDFEAETGIKVNAVYDTEEAKSTGL